MINQAPLSWEDRSRVAKMARAIREAFEVNIEDCDGTIDVNGIAEVGYRAIMPWPEPGVTE